MNKKKTIFISTAIPYVNAAPHIGHALEFVQADTLARYQRLIGNDVYFLSGTDDNALKNVLKAEEAGEDIKEYIARHTKLFEELLHKLNISNDDFIRTSVDERHIRGAQKLWQSFKPEDIIKKTYKGFYCVGCEEFKTVKELMDGRCPEHPNVALEEVEEENYFFKLGNYSQQLEHIIVSNVIRITPRSRKNEVLAFIRGGLEDLSISRSVARARGWGVPVPGDPSQVQYVWVDALSNYITALGYADDSERYKKYWNNESIKIHIIGKGITRFHAIYWPAFLLSAGIPLPSDEVVHGYITSGGQKMSKSIGNVIDPFSIVDEYGIDALRYFLARHVHPFEDSDFTMEKFKEIYNANLANGLGNLAARVMQLAESNLDKPVFESGETFVFAYSPQIRDAMQSYDLNAVMDNIWAAVSEIDQSIQKDEPFKVVKEDKQRGAEMIVKMVKHLAWIAKAIEPFMPETSATILAAVLANKKPANLFPRKE